MSKNQGSDRLGLIRILQTTENAALRAWAIDELHSKYSMGLAKIGRLIGKSAVRVSQIKGINSLPDDLLQNFHEDGRGIEERDLIEISWLSNEFAQQAYYEELSRIDTIKTHVYKEIAKDRRAYRQASETRRDRLDRLESELEDQIQKADIIGYEILKLENQIEYVKLHGLKHPGPATPITAA